MLEVVGAHRAEAGGEPRPPAAAALVGVELAAEPDAPPRLEQPGALLHRVGALLAEGVDEAGEPGGALHPAGARPLDEAGAVALGKGVEGEVGGEHLGELRVLPEGQRGGELAELGLILEPVAALHLDGGGAGAEHPPRPGPRRRHQLLELARTGGGHRGPDPAAGVGDLLVAPPRGTGCVLVRTLPEPDEVAVGVHEPGHDRVARGVDDHRVGGERMGGDLALRPHRADLPVSRGDRPALDHPGRRAALRVAGDEPPDVAHQQGGGGLGHAPSAAATPRRRCTSPAQKARNTEPMQRTVAPAMSAAASTSVRSTPRTRGSAPSRWAASWSWAGSSPPGMLAGHAGAKARSSTSMSMST